MDHNNTILLQYYKNYKQYQQFDSSGLKYLLKPL